MSPRDFAPDLAPTSPPSASETSSPLAPSLKGGEVVSTSPRDLAPAASCPTCLKPIEPTGKRGRPRKYHEGCEPVRRKVRGGLAAAELTKRSGAAPIARGFDPLPAAEALAPLIEAGLVERVGRTYRILQDLAVSEAWDTRGVAEPGYWLELFEPLGITDDLLDGALFRLRPGPRVERFVETVGAVAA